MTAANTNEALAVEDTLRHLARVGRIDSVDLWVGVSNDELRRFEFEVGRSLPDGYRHFLLRVGVSGAAALEDGSALLWPEPTEFHELLSEMLEAPLSERCTPILLHQGYYVQWIDADTGEVLGWTESEPAEAPTHIAASFVDWLNLFLDE